jgi:acyl-[acyl-carrier-protein]-phospholipid O-acyltransferase/long-chain-fatty-acid--[acyl-carrier-protein] ligase
MCFALMAQGKTPAMLNFSSGMKTMLTCCDLAGVKEIITSKAFLTKAKIDPLGFTQAGYTLIYAEDLRTQVSAFDKIAALLRNKLRFGNRLLVATPETDTAFILFTSGSEGTPKGVELSHQNLLANVRQATAVIDVTDQDRFFNALPLFHSFGLTAGTLFPLIRGCYTFLFPSPLMYRAIPTVIYDKNCTVIFGTNTFLNGYAKKAHAYDFQSVKYLIAGAEKIQQSTFNTYAQKFGVRILEGYGATECSPLISVNTRMNPLVGSAGKLVPGMEYRLEAVPGVEEGGRLFVKGPNVMKGYLNPDANATFKVLNGWYDTGDIVTVDRNKTLFIKGRMKRFAKISGEMVSLTAIEDALAGAFTAISQRCEVAVVSIPNADKGEALIAVTNEPRLTLKDIREVLKSKGLSNLCAPRALQVMAKIPKLGTGKVNHREMTELVLQSVTVEPEDETEV